MQAVKHVAIKPANHPIHDIHNGWRIRPADKDWRYGAELSTVPVELELTHPDGRRLLVRIVTENKFSSVYPTPHKLYLEFVTNEIKNPHYAPLNLFDKQNALKWGMAWYDSRFVLGLPLEAIPLQE